MRVTNAMRSLTAVKKVAYVTRMFSAEFGNTTGYWLKRIQKSKVYEWLFDYPTGVWREGELYIHDCLCQEFGLPIQYIDLSEQMKKVTDYNVLFIQALILRGLNEKCNLTHLQVTEIIEKTDLIEFMEETYEILHQQGLYANLEEVQQYLGKHYGIKIKIYE